MQPFAKCTPLALKEITLQKIYLRHAADTYCKLINFRSVNKIRLFSCPGADSLLSELCKSTQLPDKLDCLEFKHDDNREQEGLNAIDGFLVLVSGIKFLTIDVSGVQSLPAAAGIMRHSKTLRYLNVHANPPPEESDDEHVYDYSSFQDICKSCTELEQLSVAFPSVSLIRDKQDSFLNFEVRNSSPFRAVHSMLTVSLELLRRPPQSGYAECHDVAAQRPLVRQAPPPHLRTPSPGSGAEGLREERCICGSAEPQPETGYYRVWSFG
jgi:hypothetical protein